eukprot:370085_1
MWTGNDIETLNEELNRRQQQLPPLLNILSDTWIDVLKAHIKKTKIEDYPDDFWEGRKMFCELDKTKETVGSTQIIEEKMHVLKKGLKSQVVNKAWAQVGIVQGLIDDIKEEINYLKQKSVNNKNINNKDINNQNTNNRNHQNINTAPPIAYKTTNQTHTKKRTAVISNPQSKQQEIKQHEIKQQHISSQNAHILNSTDQHWVLKLIRYKGAKAKDQTPTEIIITYTLTENKEIKDLKYKAANDNKSHKLSPNWLKSQPSDFIKVIVCNMFKVNPNRFIGSNKKKLPKPEVVRIAFKHFDFVIDIKAR